ncbi:hypothetical protein RCL_jg7344.t1 [Rhizophagus clarus]|uniref:Uncharacterized protein n=1 Tax=Rhizophagus clarus TaxID=94130 RepID=A0A8H3L6W0_9GLOM|nr:hypothetical protein RCL_jg7344.t1 [Rhizophagus clarus]
MSGVNSMDRICGLVYSNDFVFIQSFLNVLFEDDSAFLGTSLTSRISGAKFAHKIFLYIQDIKLKFFLDNSNRNYVCRLA